MVFLYSVASICKSSRSYSRGCGSSRSRFRGMRFIVALILSHRFIVVNSTKMAGLRVLGRGNKRGGGSPCIVGPLVMMQIKNRISLYDKGINKKNSE